MKLRKNRQKKKDKNAKYSESKLIGKKQRQKKEDKKSKSSEWKLPEGK